MLKDNGFVVDAFNNPILTLSSFEQGLYALALIDFRMPHMNGDPVLDGGSTVSTAITFQVTATPGTTSIAGFECSLDGYAFSRCASGNPTTINFDNLEAGKKHTFEVRAVDTHGNKDPNPARFTWTVLTPSVPSGWEFKDPVVQLELVWDLV